MQAMHAKKLEQALRSRERFPVNLEWMVDVFKYKHISSLTTHLKRHFKMNVHYKRFSQEQNKRVWTYFISVDCFIGICEYVRHAARKKIANLWLRKVGIKGSARRITREYHYSSEEDEEEEQEDEEEQENEYFEEEIAQPSEEPGEGDEEYQGEEDDGEETDERGYFQEEGEEEYEDSSSFQADSEEEEDTVSSSMDYDSSSSSFDTPPMRHRTASLTISNGGNFVHGFNRQFTQSPFSQSRSLSFSSDSYSSSPASSAPSSPVIAPRFNPFAQSNAHSNANASANSNGNGFSAQNSNFPVSPTGTQGFGGSPQFSHASQQVAASAAPQNIPAFVPRAPQNNTAHFSAAPVTPQAPVPVKSETPAATMPIDKVDWSYLIRPTPVPVGAALSDLSHKLFASILYSPQFCQQPPVHHVMLNSNSFFAPFSHNVHYNHHGHFARQDESAFGERLPDLPFDTNMFLSIPENETHYFQ